MAAEIHTDVAAETSDDETVLLSEEPKNRDWLIEIMNDVEPEQPPKPRIPKVDKALRQTESNNRYFEPLVVSFGPYHHDEDNENLKPMESYNENLKPMESYKKVAAAWFISREKGKQAKEVTDEEAISVYEKFIERAKNVPSPTYWYDKDVFKFKSEEHFMRMMFLDGCFILYFIHHIVTGSSSSSDEYILKKSSHHLNKKHIARDMFLLENQIPYPILECLMSLLPDKEMQNSSSIIKFICMVFLPTYEMNFSPPCCLRVIIWIISLFLPTWKQIFHNMWNDLFEKPGKKPLHLLDVLREVLIGVRDSPAGASADYWNYYFRPIRELKAAGIQVRRSRGITLKNLKFKKGLLNSHLEIPQIIVDDSTRGSLLNLVAYEMCPHGPKDGMFTSYICLLDSLIDHAEDVKELQDENILLNSLGSGEVVNNLFKKLAANLSPDSNAYAHVINGIKAHHERYFNSERVRIGEWIGQFKRTYFSSPWTLISLIAAAFITLLTLLQTIYTMWGFYKTY